MLVYGSCYMADDVYCLVWNRHCYLAVDVYVLVWEKVIWLWMCILEYGRG